MAGELMSGVVKKGQGDSVRLWCDFGDVPQLQEGATVVSQNVTTSGSGAPVVAGIELTYPYQLSAKFTGGTAGNTYNVVFTITLNDADATVITRTGQLEVV